VTAPDPAVTTECATAAGTDVPKLGLGTWRLTGDACYDAVRTALDAGYRHVDTAQAYDNEATVGRAIGDADVDREDVFLTTKVWGRNARPSAVRTSARASLDRLGVDRVDLLLIHWPNPLVAVEDTIGALADLRDGGVAREIGVSNYGIPRLDRARDATDAPILTDQVQCHPYRPRSELLEYCQRRGLLLTAYSPLAHGGVVRDATLRRIGARYDKTPAQVALRWLVGRENVVTIPKATSERHIRENAAIFDFELTDGERDRVARASRLRTGFAWARGRLGV
jgi:diketogulonate reductase-like aldo/keto reductase